MEGQRTYYKYMAFGDHEQEWVDGSLTSWSYKELAKEKGIGVIQEWMSQGVKRGAATERSAFSEKKKPKKKAADKSKREKENFFSVKNFFGVKNGEGGEKTEGVVDDEIFSKLLDMGYDEELCRKTAIKHHGDKDGAIIEVLNKSVG